MSCVPGPIAQLTARLTAVRSREFEPRPRGHKTFMEINQEIISTVIISRPLIKEGQLSITGESTCTDQCMCTKY